ncbi:AraC family transcriptional regulator [Saccharomonospora piscinae]|uniref:AraC family transcriptional regulator n=1 Tax=Saccharomonospora piscinae TaxID=687388 RepID=UPI0004652025|nr:AraC family transcriptional regulator [Saccharomonospora piscinae]
MDADELSEVLDLIEVRSMPSGGFAARAPWVAGTDIEDSLKFVAIVSGRARLSADGIDHPVVLESGDVAILNDRSWVRLDDGSDAVQRREVEPEQDFSSPRLRHADRSTDDVVVGGRIDLSPAGRLLLHHALPPVAHVKGTKTSIIRESLDRLFAEVTSNRMGSGFAVRQYSQLILLEVLRAYVEQTDVPPGWLRVLTDETLRPALRLLHAGPGTPCGLQELASATAMSRTSFAERFRAVAGVPPLAYRTRWRMLQAQRALRDDDTRIGVLAASLGYSSEAAFSTAFKREVGESPIRYRRRLRPEASPSATTRASRAPTAPSSRKIHSTQCVG